MLKNSQDLGQESDDDENDRETGEHPLLQDDHHGEEDDLGDWWKEKETSKASDRNSDASKVLKTHERVHREYTSRIGS